MSIPEHDAVPNRDRKWRAYLLVESRSSSSKLKPTSWSPTLGRARCCCCTEGRSLNASLSLVHQGYITNI